MRDHGCIFFSLAFVQAFMLKLVQIRSNTAVFCYTPIGNCYRTVENLLVLVKKLFVNHHYPYTKDGHQCLQAFTSNFR